MRYISTEAHPIWEHIFDEKDGVTQTMWVYDTQEEKIVSAIIKDLGSGQWRNANKDEIGDLEDSVKNANNECLEKPEEWSLSQHIEIPCLDDMVSRLSQLKM